MKVHTSHKDVVEKILNDIRVIPKGQYQLQIFSDGQDKLNYVLIDDYFKF